MMINFNFNEIKNFYKFQRKLFVFTINMDTDQDEK